MTNYHFPRRALALLMLGACCTTSCRDATEAPQAAGTYFDMETFMQGEIKKLTAENPAIEKSVFNGDAGETKVLHITDWATELSAFAQVDINKVANKGLYKVENIDCETTYTALQPNLNTQKIVLHHGLAGKIKSIYIQKMTHNLLYASQEDLYYYPDSAYEIRKQQDIRILGSKKYQIQGKLKKEL